MREIRVHVPAPLASGLRLQLPVAAAAHVARVLRLAAGDALALFDGRGAEHEARIEAIKGGRVEVLVGARRAGTAGRESPLRVTLLQALARGEKMDWVLQKATELGVARIAPVATGRSVVQLDGERADKRLAHWQGVVAAACEQCGRNVLPEVLAPAPLAAACAALPAGLRLVLSPEAALPLVSALAAREAPRDSVTLLIGPEGGLDAGELELAARAGFVAVTLGPRVLRTETAAIAALGILQALAGDLGAA